MLFTIWKAFEMREQQKCNMRVPMSFAKSTIFGNVLVLSIQISLKMSFRPVHFITSRRIPLFFRLRPIKIVNSLFTDVGSDGKQSASCLNVLKYLERERERERETGAPPNKRLPGNLINSFHTLYWKAKRTHYGRS